MRIGNIQTSDYPAEFVLNTAGNTIFGAEWRTEIEATQTPPGFRAKVQSVERCVPLTEGDAKKLLMACRYADPSEECSILRRPVEDEERAEHEAYYARVCDYIATLITE